MYIEKDIQRIVRLIMIFFVGGILLFSISFAQEENQLGKARDFYRRGNYKEAIIVLETLIEKIKGNELEKKNIAQAYYLLARIYYEAGQDPKVEEYLKLAIAADVDIGKDEDNPGFKACRDLILEEWLKNDATRKPANFILTVKNVQYEMIGIAGGEFQMGSNDGDPNERPVHTVRLSRYRLGKTEVTQGLWQAVMGKNPSEFQKGDNYPVENVSWDDCRAFIQKLNQMTGGNYRLPTEAEWEYACRAGTSGDYYGNVDEIGWYSGNSGSSTHPVGQKKGNAFGLYDMSGNVWEWCQDWYGPYNSTTQTDPTGPSSGAFRVFRGGSWILVAGALRSAYRGGYGPGDRYSALGFRLASGSTNGG